MTEQSTDQPVISTTVTYTGPGGYDRIAVVKRLVRAPTEGEVRIAVAAAAVNPTDLGLRETGYPDYPFTIVPGMDAAGTIESVGPGVSRFRIGEKVMAIVMPRRPEGGAQAQYIVVPAASVVAIPDGCSLSEASTLPMNGLTALRALELSGLGEGDILAVSGGAGLLARYAIAVAKRRGITTIADARPEQAELLRSYGTTVVVERSSDFSSAIRMELSAGADALLDTALLGQKAFGAIRDGGVYIPVRGWADKVIERGIKVKPVFVYQVAQRTDWLALLREMVGAREIKLEVSGEYLPEDAADAQQALASGGFRGRPVITF